MPIVASAAAEIGLSLGEPFVRCFHRRDLGRHVGRGLGLGQLELGELEVVLGGSYGGQLRGGADTGRHRLVRRSRHRQAVAGLVDRLTELEHLGLSFASLGFHQHVVHGPHRLLTGRHRLA